jgi:EAL domain-containing protein (putative c-di-GMP-specific phosphodiesterase class I)/GGDEF domain-containing protein
MLSLQILPNTWTHRYRLPRRWLAAAGVVPVASAAVTLSASVLWPDWAMPLTVSGLLSLGALGLGVWLGRSGSSSSPEDPLTGFLSREAMQIVLEEHLADPLPEARRGALIHCELTGAPAIAATHGMAAEEEIIREAAARLKGLLPSAATAARVGRGSFLVFLAGETDQLALAGLARAIISRLAAGLEAGGLTLTCACHSGIALAPDDGATAGDLIASAELALAAVREQDTPGYGFFDPASAAAAVRRREVQRAVAAAHARGAFRLVYQPVYAMRTGELTGFEALMRMQDKELGPVPPSEFIPAAEQAGLIAPIGEWALEEACRNAAMWPSHLVVAVNLSPAQFLAGTLVRSIRDSLERHQLPPYRLEVEITEGTLIKDSDLVLGQLRILREMGVGVALDDFGTGYSSLSYLWKFPFSKIKIDRSFVLALEQSASAKGILRSIVKLGHGLGMTVTAEGIEGQKQLASLRELGCDLAQGYLLGRPAAPDELAAIIMRNFAFHVGRKARDATAASASRSA